MNECSVAERLDVQPAFDVGGGSCLEFGDGQLWCLFNCKVEN